MINIGGTHMYIDTRDGRWVIRWSRSGGKIHQIETAFPLPQNEVRAAKIIAGYDLNIILSPVEPCLVWLSKNDEELENHPLTR